MKFYGGKRKAAYLRKKHEIGRLSGVQRGLLWMLAALALLGGAAGALCKTAARPMPMAAAEKPEAAQRMRAQPEEKQKDRSAEPEPSAVLPASRKKGVYNILLCGVDADGLRTDTIMIGHLDAETGKAALMSIPRDTPVEAADGSLMKLNAVYAGGGKAGMERLQTQLAALLGFETDGYVLIGLDALRQAVDLVGGVEFCVPQDMDYSDPAQGLEIHLKAGTQRLNGEQALQLVRYRKGYAMQDIRRTEVQQAFLKALAANCLTAKNLAKLPELLTLARENVTTDLTMGNLVYFVRVLSGCDLEAVETGTLEGEGVTVNGVSYFALYEQPLLRMVNGSFHSYDTPVTAEMLRLITPEKLRNYQKPSSQTAETEIELPEEPPAQTEIRLMPNDPAFWEQAGGRKEKTND